MKRIKKILIFTIAFVVIVVLIATPGLWSASRIKGWFSGSSTSSYSGTIGVSGSTSGTAGGSIAERTGHTYASIGMVEDVGYTQQTEAYGLNDEINMDTETRTDAHLRNVSIKELIDLTIEPFGSKDDNPYEDVIFTMEYKELHGFFPTEDEINAYRDSLIESALEAKREAARAAAASGTPTPSLEPSPTGGATPAPTPGPAPVPAPTPSVCGTSSTVSPERTSVVTLARRKPKDSEPITIDDGTGSTPPPTGTSAPSPTEEPTPDPAEGVTLSDEELEAIEQSVNEWIAEQTYEEEVFVTREYTLSGEQLRLFKNSFHTPWQANYVLADMIEVYNNSVTGEYNSDDTGIQIQRRTLRRVSEIYNSIRVELMVDFWQMDEDTDPLEENIHISLTLDNYAGKLTSVNGDKCYRDWYIEYDEPVPVKDGEVCLSQWGFIPIVLVDHIEDWALRKEYSSTEFSEDGISELTRTPWGYEPQKVKNDSSDMSILFKRLKATYDFGDADLTLMSEMLNELPEGEEHALRFRTAIVIADRAGHDGKVVDPDTLDWIPLLTGDQAIIVRNALSRLGDIYSMDLRDREGYADCSSFAHWVYLQSGIDIAWRSDSTAAGEAYACKMAGCVIDRIYDPDNLEPGDLLFWDHSSRRDNDGAYLKIDHVGVYIGNGIIVDASSNWGCVVCREMWGEDQIVCVARPFDGHW